MKKISLLFLALFISATALFAQPIKKENEKKFQHSPLPEALDWANGQRIIGELVTPLPPPTEPVRPIAEFEPSEGVLVRYPFSSNIPVTLIKEMAKDVTVIIIVANSSEQSTALSQLNSGGVNTANCKFLTAPSDTKWTRDYGPWFMAIDNNEVGMFDFNYNRIKFGHGGSPRTLDNQINTHLTTYLSQPGNGKPIVRYASSFYLTGGNYMNDGIKQAFSTTLILNENTEYTQTQLDEQFLAYLGIEKYHFRQDPIVPLDQIQHIDCWAKLLAPDKVLIDSVPPSNTTYYPKFEAAAAYFKLPTTLSSYGTPYKVIRVYAPGAGSTSATTPYSNSLILNNKVFVPINATPTANDNAALQVYQQAMPGYEIIGIPFGSWLNTDALHCRTHEIADRGMLYVKHQPKFGEIANTGTINFSTELYSYGNNTIYSDSVIVYLRVNNGCYHAYHMENAGNNTWEVNISGLPSGTVEYYIYAADVSGRRESHPYIARYAPDKGAHKFTLTGTGPALPALALDKASSSVTSEGFDVIKDFIALSNPGFANLSFEITNIDFHEMLTIAPLNGTIQPCGSQTITLSYDFTNVQSGTYLGSFTLTSNDPKNPETEIALFAKQNAVLPAPVLHLSKTSSSVYAEEITIVEDFITVSNLGNADLTFNINEIDFNEMLTIEPQTGTVPEGDSLIITLSYNFNIVAKGAEYLGSFFLSSNDPENPKVEVTLKALLNLIINDAGFSDILIYPNPTNGELTIDNGKLTIKGIEFFDVLGRMQKSRNAEKQKDERKMVLDVSNLPAGVYFVKIYTKENQIVLKKLIINN